MRKVLAVTMREYRAAVQTKAFVFGLLMVPIIGALSLAMQLFVARSAGEKTMTYAIIDRTHLLRPALDAALARHNDVEVFDPVTHARSAPRFAVEYVEPAEDSGEQRLALSQRHVRGELDGFLEIGPDVLRPVPPGVIADDGQSMRYQSDKDIERDFLRWASRAVSAAVQEQRLAAHGVPSEVMRELERPVPSKVRGSTKRNPVTGALEDTNEDSKAANTALPLALVVLMLVMVMLGAIPAMQAVVEEKQQRIAEVLLGSIPPFQLMLGKLLSVVLVTLTISAFYLGGGYAIAARFGVRVAPVILAWFVLFLILSTLIYGSLFTAIGAAATDLKETQSLQMPATMLLTLPTFFTSAILREPNGTIATFGSFFPFSAPLLMTARLATTGGVPWWQPPLAALEVLLVALACVWAAGRIFRVGLLMQGKGVRLRDLARWVVRG